MDAQPRFHFDRVHGIELRAMPRHDRRGWTASWRPARALQDIPRFTYITREEIFPSADEAIDFLRLNAGELLSRGA